MRRHAKDALAAARPDLDYLGLLHLPHNILVGGEPFFRGRNNKILALKLSQVGVELLLPARENDVTSVASDPQAGAPPTCELV